ncbi:hypothetical protein XENTR_v10001309 [Xenopus tropicalis]|nr:hypothetical protein XENTR_v10001309 [Xenopus tropicalis]
MLLTSHWLGITDIELYYQSLVCNVIVRCSLVKNPEAIIQNKSNPQGGYVRILAPAAKYCIDYIFFTTFLQATQNEKLCCPDFKINLYRTTCTFCHFKYITRDFCVIC